MSADKDSVSSDGVGLAEEFDDIEIGKPVDISPDGDGMVFKTVHVAPTGVERPPSGSRVEVHYSGFLEATGDKFDSSLDRGKPFTFELGKGQVIRGWDVGVATMKVGEKCTLLIHPDFGYGSSGSPPKIPGDAWLKFDVELLSFSDEIDVTYGRRTVLKRILRKSPESDWRSPNDFAVCHVRYEVIGPDGEEWGSSSEDPFARGSVGRVHLDESEGGEKRELGKPRKITVAEDLTFEGFETVLRSMKKGELAEIKFAATELTLGCRSVFADAMPADASKVVYAAIAAGRDGFTRARIELVDFDAPKESYEMSDEEKCDTALEMKNGGNAAFKDGRLDTAVRRYDRGADYVRSLDRFTDDAMRTRAAELAATCNSNAAQVHLRLKDHKAAIKAATDALAADPKHAKSLYRRAEAHRALREFEDAVKDLDAILASDPEHTAAKTLLAHSKADIRKIEKNQRKLYSKMMSA